MFFWLAIFFAVSRDNLRRYYSRAALLLGTLNKEFFHEQRSHPTRFPPVHRHAQSAAEARGNPGKQGGDDEGGIP
jgi:hypothetical protein